MSKHDRSEGLFPALLKHWRRGRGLSQLDLALIADVSSRHISFLETGRSAPTASMVLRLCTALDVPLRHTNAMLKAAGYEAAFPEPPLGEALPSELRRPLDLMKAHQEPFPWIAIDRAYNVLDLNLGAQRLFAALLGDVVVDAAAGMNLIRLCFDPRGARSVIVNFDEVGRELLWRLQRESLEDPNDHRLRELLDQTLELPTVPRRWREADFAVPAAPALGLRLRADDVELSFVIMVTSFQTPQAVWADELRIETWFPNDEPTAEFCQQLAARRTSTPPPPRLPQK